MRVGPPGIARSVLLGGSALAVSLLPMFLIGALAVPVTRELGFGTLGLGTVVAMHRLASTPAAVYAGRLADHLGASRSLRLSAAAVCLSCLGIATTAHDWLTLAAWLAVSGCAMALADPAANRLLVTTISADRLGAAFGMKQSAAPLASMLAGASVPVVAVTLGWRAAFVATAVASALVVAAVGRAPARRPRPAGARSGAPLARRSLVVTMALAMGLATASSSTVPAFFVLAAVGAGSAVGTAGAVLAVAGLVTIATRLVAGPVADRMTGGHLGLAAGGQLVGCLGFGLLMTNRPLLMAAGALLALAGTWGFHGVYWYSMVSAFPRTPGAITGAIAPGALLGGVAGPLLFGAVAGELGYSAGWALAACLAVLAAMATRAAAARLEETGTDG